LEEQGVDTIFGVPGEENADIMISLLSSPIEFITCRHEQSASFMADMYGRLTGKPGVCLATLGPGATNLLTGVANANMDHAPLVAIVGQADTNRLHKESHQNMNAVSMYEPVTKWATSIREASVIPEVVYKAFKVASTPKAGAVMLELPEDIAKHEVDADVIKANDAEMLTSVHPEQLTQVLKTIENSKAPLLLAGYGASFRGCDNEIKKFMDKTKIFGAATFMGKGSIDARSMQSLYCVGLGMRDIALQAFEKSDLVITLGYGLVEWLPEHWNANKDKKIIHISAAPAEVDKNYIPQIELVGDIRDILAQLNTQLSDKHAKDPNMFARLRKQISDELTQHAGDDSWPVKPQRILSDLRSVLAEDDILISDVGAHKMWVARQYPTYRSKTCFIHNGFCSMGGAIPGAVTAKRVHPQKRIVALCGDGGFMMSIQAIVTAVDLKLPIVVLVWEDDHYGLIKWKQEAAYHTYSHVDLKNPDLVELARCFGCHSERINATSELIPKLEAAFKVMDKPSVIVVPVDYSENMKLTKRLGEILAH
jgi:acetolactate synthase-1/2/3 large subunit